jgi:hypothetical protein
MTEKTPTPKTVYSWAAKLARKLDPDKNGRELAQHKKDFESMVLMQSLSRENGRMQVQRLILIMIIIILIMLLLIAGKIAIQKTFE